MPLRRLAVALVAAGTLAACGPQGPMGVVPGGPFLGFAEAAPVNDWAFSEDHLLVAIETRRGVVRHAVTVLCAAHDGSLYIPSRQAPRKRWVQNLLADPRVRVRVGDRIYDGRATRVTASLPGSPVERAFLRKYYGIEVDDARFLFDPPAEGDDRAEVWVFRIDAGAPS